MQNTGKQNITDRKRSWHSLRFPRFAVAVPDLGVLLTGAGVWLVFVLFMGLVQFSTPDLPDNDGFYHIKMAYLMRTEGLKPDFPWLPLTILNPREYYNHHFLFHAALIPFTFGDLRIGAKIASVLFSSLAFLAVWRLLYNQRVAYASLWAFGLLAASEAFVFRMSITRTQSLSLAVLAIAVSWLLSKKFTRLFFLAFFYVWLYNAFPLLLFVAGIYSASVLLVEHKLDLKPVLITGVGLAAGVLINPYFPYNLLFAYQHILPKLVDATAVSVGSEWYPYSTAQLLSNSPFTLVLFLSSILALGLSARRMELRTAAAFLWVCLFGLMLFQSRRFIEYFPPFVLVFAAFAWDPLIQQFRASKAASQGEKGSLRPYLPAAVLLAVLLPFAWLTLVDSRASIRTSSPYQLYQGASNWLQSNTPAGERIFQTDWDDFPRLFYYNTHNTYLVGLDPTYMQFYDADLYDLWVDITRGRVDQPSQSIAARFRSRYVLTDLHHDGFLRKAERDPCMVEVYRDEDAVIFEILSSLN
jgi:hypothetical protein